MRIVALVVAPLALGGGCSYSPPDGENQPACPVIYAPGEQTQCESCQEVPVYQPIMAGPPIMPAEQAIRISVAWEDHCSCWEGVEEHACNQRELAVAARCTGVSCSASPPDQPVLGEAAFDVIAHAPGTLTIPVEVTDLSTGSEATTVVGPIEIRVVTGIAFDCIVDGDVPCGSTIPAGHDLVVIAKAVSAQGTFPFSLGAVTISDREAPPTAAHAYDCEQNACAWSGVSAGTITVDASWNGVPAEQTYTVR